jgi:hypothetical protein
LLLCAIPLFTGHAASAGGETVSAGAKREEHVPISHLRDKSKITGWPQIESLQVETPYGTLIVPRDQLVRVRFARRLPPDLRAKIEQLIDALGDEDFDKREAATQGLKEIGPPALGFLKKATKSSNEEVKSRAASLVAELREQVAGDERSVEDALPQIAGSEDEVVTVRMTIKGRVPAEQLLIKTRYGNLRVAVADLNGILFKPTGPTSVTVDVSAQVQPPANWVDTKLEVEKDQKIKITASGQIMVNNYGIVSGPAGNREWSGYATFGNFPMLSLVGKVGKKGKPFLVGTSYSGRVKGKGRLYLAVVPFSPYPGGATGNYQAKIRALGTD